MLQLIRIIFLLLVAAVGLTYTMVTVKGVLGDQTNLIVYIIMVGGVVASFAIITVDLLIKKKNLRTLSGLFFGLLVGIAVSIALGYLVDQIASVFIYRPVLAAVQPAAPPEPSSPPVIQVQVTVAPQPGVQHFAVTPTATQAGPAAPATAPHKPRANADLAGSVADEAFNATMRSVLQGAKLLMGLIVTYITVSFILQTKDDFRFIVPYVEFQRATKGPRPVILDTSVIIDGRIADVAASGVFESRIIVPRFVLTELQAVADSGDRLKRSRGRRGLEVLQRLQAMPKLELHIWDGTLANAPESQGVDEKLVALGQQEHGRIVTNDFNLNKIAQLRGVDVININSIADALKPVVLPGEQMRVRIVKPGESQGQGVGYLEDGTMVVVEGARDRIGTEIQITVTNALQTAAGKMIFGRMDSLAPAAAQAAAAISKRPTPA